MHGPYPLVAGVIVYEADGKFNKFVPADETGELVESITVGKGQLLVIVYTGPRVVPHPGAVIDKLVQP